MPEYDRTLGPEVGEIAALAGFAPDPEQQLILDDLFALGPKGKARVRDYGICGPRQNFKTGVLKQATLGWLFLTDQRLIVWSAHEFGTAQEAFRDMTELLESAPDLDREIKHIHRGNGDEAIELFRDRRLKFKARTKSGGRGLTGNKIVLDEAMYLRASHMGALIPTLRAVPDPQVVLAGSGGMVDSDIWRGYRDQGRRGGDPRSGWLEYGDQHPWECEEHGCDHHYGVEGCALDDKTRWWALNTALGRRITEDTLEADRRKLPPREFARETVTWWEDPPVGGGIIDLDLWSSLAVPNTVEMAAPEFAVEVALDRSRTTIGAAWLVNGKPHVEVVDELPGTAGAVQRLVDLTSRYGGSVTVDGLSEAAELIPDLEKAGVRVAKLSAADRAAACGGFYDAATAGGLTHVGDPAVTAAIQAATWTTGSDRRAFERRRSAGPIAALYVIAFALQARALRGSTYEGRGLVTL